MSNKEYHLKAARITKDGSGYDTKILDDNNNCSAKSLITSKRTTNNYGLLEDRKIEVHGYSNIHAEWVPNRYYFDEGSGNPILMNSDEIDSSDPVYGKYANKGFIYVIYDNDRDVEYPDVLAKKSEEKMPGEIRMVRIDQNAWMQSLSIERAYTDPTLFNPDYPSTYCTEPQRIEILKRPSKLGGSLHFHRNTLHGVYAIGKEQEVTTDDMFERKQNGLLKVYNGIDGVFDMTFNPGTDTEMVNLKMSDELHTTAEVNNFQ